MDECGFGNIGFLQIAILYLFYCPCSFFATVIIAKMTEKWSMFMGAVTFIFFVGTFILPSLYDEYQHEHGGAKPTAGIL